MKLSKLPKKIKDLAGLISAVAVIGGSLVACGHWIVAEVSSTTSARIDALEAKIDANQTKNELAVTRLELMVLIEHDPTNVVEIEKLAKHYFLDLEGDTYVTSVVSQWCKEQSVNCGEILLK